jgi:PAS domain S-box-containing protein
VSERPSKSAEDRRRIEELSLEIEQLRAELYEYRRAQESVRDTAQRLRAVVEHAPIVVFAVDRDGVFTLSEGRGLESLGLKPGQVVGMSALDLYKDVPQIRENLRACLAGSSVNDVVRIGDLVFESIYTPRRNASGVVIGVSGVAWEVTQRVRAEEAAKALEAQLFQAQKMETIGTLAGGIAHDFNNILSPILGYTDLALSLLNANDPVREDLEQVIRAAHRAKELVEQILIFSRRGDEMRRPLQLHLIVLEALKLIRSSLPSTVEVEQRVETRDDTVFADPAQMHQVFINLCTNAAHAMREINGVLRIEMARETVDPQTATRVQGLKPGDYVVLTVRDQGEGMEATTQARIFEPFFTTKKPGEGTGLGLSVVHGIVMSHGGAIDVTSQRGQGSTFRVYLPSAPPAAADTEHARVPDTKARGEHILVVDDEPDVTRVLTRILESQGYRVTPMTSSEAALTAFRQSPDDFAAVITDQTMPRMTGVELARAIHAVSARTPVILTTGYRGKLTVEAVERDIAGVAAKPFDVLTLTATLRAALDGAEGPG